MAMKLMLTLLVLMKVVIADITDLTETYCPLCAMIVEKDVKVSFRGNQNVYACSMGGEKKNLEENMVLYVLHFVVASRRLKSILGIRYD